MCVCLWWHMKHTERAITGQSGKRQLHLTVHSPLICKCVSAVWMFDGCWGPRCNSGQQSIKYTLQLEALCRQREERGEPKLWTLVLRHSDSQVRVRSESKSEESRGTKSHSLIESQWLNFWGCSIRTTACICLLVKLTGRVGDVVTFRSDALRSRHQNSNKGSYLNNKLKHCFPQDSPQCGFDNLSKHPS